MPLKNGLQLAKCQNLYSLPCVCNVNQQGPRTISKLRQSTRKNPRFSDGQLYVACSSVGNPTNLYILAPEGKAKNIVYLTALQ